MKVTKLTVTHFDQCLWSSFDRQFDLRMCSPMEKYCLGLKEWFWDRCVAVVEIETDEGHSGIGWCEDGCSAVPGIINNHLGRLVVGQDPFDYEGIWDRLYRASIPYGRKGAALEAIAAIDIALWDIMGKATKKSVAALLGGAGVQKVPVYASGLHHVEPEKTRAESADYVKQGYTAMKCRFAYGPADGAAGMKENVEHVRAIREAVGDGIGIMVDAYMGWNLPYAIEICRHLDPLDISWLEEPFLPDDLNSYAELRRRTSIPVAGGEHEFTRFGFQQMLEKGAIDIIQLDLHRCGGITEGRRIANLASAYNLPVNPHAFSSVHAAFVAATPGAHYVEYFPIPIWEREEWKTMPPLIQGQPGIERGFCPVPQGPGLGISLNRELT